MKIGRNDATLAHALAKGVAGEQFEQDIARLHHRANGYTGKRTMKGAFRELKRIFGERVIYEHIEREKGSRARGFLFILEPVTTGNMVLVMLAWVKGEVKQHGTPIVVTHHALARMMQRTVGEADLSACIEKLTPYVMAGACETINKHRLIVEDVQLMVAGGGGLLIFRKEGRYILAKTWMDASIILDPSWRAVALEEDLSTWWENAKD